MKGDKVTENMQLNKVIESLGALGFSQESIMLWKGQRLFTAL